MSSGSLKDLSKALTAVSANLTLPLPHELVRVLDAYIDKHSPQDEQESQSLQEELLEIYETSFLGRPASLAPFLRVLHSLKPVLRGSGRSLQWWDKLSTPVMLNLGREKLLAIEASNTLRDTLVYDEEEEASRLEDAQATSDAVGESLLAMWLEKRNLAVDQLDPHASFVVKQIQLILNAYGKKRPKDFLQLINKIFVKKSSRIPALSLLCDFFRHQPPHLHQLLQTPLFDNLLQCLQIDTSTRVISLAITALVMFLPHIPSSAADHLPALFNIYSRLLFWDRERQAADILPRTGLELGTEDETIMSEKQPLGNGKSWDKLSYLLESDDDSVPQLANYFTFLYGLYPINFMSYIRKPQRYLRHANFPGSDDLNIEPAEIRQRSEPYRQVHLLHPNFFTLTLESEISDKERWMKTEAADVVGECMALALYVHTEETTRAVEISRTKNIEPDSDIPSQSLLDAEAATPYQSRHSSWRNTQSTAVASPEGHRSLGLHRKLSQASQSMPSITDSPSLHPADLLDSPTLPPQMLTSPPNNRLSDVLSSQKSLRGSLYQALTNDSVVSLALSNNHHDPAVDAYLESLSRDHAARLPRDDPTLKIDYLQREIELLKNALNFERYLKQQHVSYIGQLRNKQNREVRTEADFQNLVNSSRTYKAKLEDAKRLNTQMRTETERSKENSRNWEAQLTTKLRALREEQKNWMTERNALRRALDEANEQVTKLKNIVVSTESKELRTRQMVESAQNSLDELERLRIEVEDLKLKVIKYEVMELAAFRALESEQATLNQIVILEMEIKSRDMELAKSKKAFEDALEATRLQASQGIGHNSQNGKGHDGKLARLTREVLDKGMASLRDRNAQLAEENATLKKKLLDMHIKLDALQSILTNPDAMNLPDTALLSRSTSPPPFRELSPTSLPSFDSMGSLSSYLSNWSSSSDSPLIPPTNPQSQPPRRSYPKPTPNVDTSYRERTSTGAYHRESSTERTPTGVDAPVQYFQAAQHFSSSPLAASSASQANSGTASSRTGSRGSNDSRTNKTPRIEVQSETRVYGRGGVQNVGRKDKAEIAKQKKEAAALAKDTQPAEPKKEKKGLSLKGIRGFV